MDSTPFLQLTVVGASQKARTVKKFLPSLRAHRGAQGGEELFQGLKGGVPGVYKVGDFAPASPANMDSCFSTMKQANEPGKSPNFVSEFYPGWITGLGQ